MNNLACFCRYRNENYYNKLLKSTTTLNFFFFCSELISESSVEVKKTCGC